MSSTRLTCAGNRALLFFLILLLGACSGGGSSGVPMTAEAIDVAGSVGDGPVINADLTFVDADGAVVGTTTSDQQANYSFTIPQGTRLPVRIRAAGGTDLVTGRALDFEMVGVLGEDATAGRSTLNISPLSTMTVRAMECTDRRFNAGQLRNMWKRIRGQVGMGLDPAILDDPLFSSIGDSSVAEIVLSSEALAEAVRRTATALQNTGANVTPAEVFDAVACDLAADGVLDGRGQEVPVRTAAVFRATSAAVALEVVAGELRVDEQIATVLMNDAIAQIQPSAAGRSVADVEISATLQQQIVNDLLLLQAQFDDSALLELTDAIANAEPAALRSTAAELLDTRRRQVLLATTTQLAMADEGTLSAVESDLARQQDSSAPFVSFFASESRVVVGDPVQLSWASSSADQCLASGGWSGVQALEGTVAIDDLSETTQFTLTCFSTGGTNRSVLEVMVIDRAGDEQVPETQPEPQPEPKPEPQPEPVPEPVPAPLPEPNPAPSPQPEPQPAPAPPSEQPAPAPQPEPQPAPEPQPEPEPEPLPAVEVELTTSASEVNSGEFVRLSWSSSNAATCTAQGGWSGNRATAGNVEVGPLTDTTSFVLNCSNGESSSSAFVAVSVLSDGTLSLSWEAPTENVDGTNLSGLSGYKIYYGTTSGAYQDSVEIREGTTSSATLTLPVGTYYLVMTALDLDNVESDYSNEVVESSR